MTVLVRIFCGACKGEAAVGLDPSHAMHNLKESGGRTFKGNVNVCKGCAEATV